MIFLNKTVVVLIIYNLNKVHFLIKFSRFIPSLTFLSPDIFIIAIFIFRTFNYNFKNVQYISLKSASLKGKQTYEFLNSVHFLNVRHICSTLSTELKLLISKVLKTHSSPKFLYWIIPIRPIWVTWSKRVLYRRLFSRIETGNPAQLLHVEGCVSSSGRQVHI